MYVIIGAGLSGLSVADHLEKQAIPFKIYESKSHGGGHIHSEVIDGFTWDEGPHVSFTKYQYVKDYFANNCQNEFLEYATKPTNYYQGDWIVHPAQSNMYAIPNPLRDDCIKDVIETRKRLPDNYKPSNYQEWIDYAFGETFAKIFPKVYTQKYWTTDPQNLTTDWIGKRIYFPDLADMVESADKPLEKHTHYISKVRYPMVGGYYSYIKRVEESLPVNYNKPVKYISFNKKEILFEDGEVITYEKLISTLPLPNLIFNSDAPVVIKDAAKRLRCSKVLIVNVVVDHPAPIDNHWIYVYDETFYSTRINFTELLSPQNGEAGKSGIQVEVYFSEYREPDKPINEIIEIVLKELVTMNLVQHEDNILSYHSKWLDWANVIFDNNRVEAQEEILHWLESVGLKREDDDLEPMTDWDTKETQPLGEIILAGRFAQWKYYWTDDCVMRGATIAKSIEKFV